MASQNEEDEKLAARLLHGRLVLDKQGLPQRAYIIKNSEDDRSARAALARLIRSEEPPRHILSALADLVDPASGSARSIMFGRGKGRPPAPAAAATIGWRVLRLMNDPDRPLSQSEAVRIVADETGRSEQAIFPHVKRAQEALVDDLRNAEEDARAIDLTDFQPHQD